MPRDARRRDVSSVVRVYACIRAVELGQRDEVFLADPRRRCGHHAAVELFEIVGEVRPARDRMCEPGAVAPWIRAQEQAALAGESLAEAAGREDDRLRTMVLGKRSLELDIAGEQLGERARVEPLARRSRILGVRPHRVGAERDEPLERVVEPLPDEPLQRLVAAWALRAEVVPLDVAPDDAARKQHRPARTRALLDHAGPEAELPRPCGADEPGHPGACDQHQRFGVGWKCVRGCARPSDLVGSGAGHSGTTFKPDPGKARRVWRTIRACCQPTSSL